MKNKKRQDEKLKAYQPSSVKKKMENDESFEDIEDSDNENIQKNRMGSNDDDTDFEDEFDDEYDQEDVIENDDWQDDGSSDYESDDDQKMVEEKQETITKQTKVKKSVTFGQEEQKVVPFLDTAKNLKEGEVLDYDNKAYEMLHRANCEWPFLSFDVILPKDQIYNIKAPNYQKMIKYPYELQIVAGSQCPNQNDNAIYVMKIKKLHKTMFDDDSVSEMSDSDNEDDEKIDKSENPEIYFEKIPIKTSINRIRAMNHQNIVSAWGENGQIMIFDISKKLEDLDEQIQNEQTVKKFVSKKNKQNSQKPAELINTFSNTVEGYALGWSHLKLGSFASGSCDRKIYVYEAQNNLSTWMRQDNPYLFHKESVEDIQFSPSEEYAFASCSVDKSVKICDTRVGDKKKAQISIDDAHQTDINVISWSHTQTRLLASGADDGCFKVWDLRHIKNGCLNEILWHTEPITGIHFQPNEESVVAVSSADNRLSIWDFSVEAEDDQMENEDIPDQLMFLHQGQENIKEIMYHPQLYEMIISTGSNGFNVFKPAINENAHQSDDEEEDNIKDIKRINEKDLDKYLAELNLNGN